MLLQKIFARLRSRRAANAPINNLDRKLVKTVRFNTWPKFNQLKYYWQFLNNQEKRIVTVCYAVISITILSWGAYFLSGHIVSVPKIGGEYSEALIGQPKYINPIFASTDEVDADLAGLVYSGLFRYDQNQKLTPDLAEKYTISTDKKTYTVYLRHNIYWSDADTNPDKPLFTANDVVYTFNTIKEQEVGSPLRISFQDVEVEKIDDYSVNFTLKTPFAPFLNSLTVGILPEHAWADTPAASIKLAKPNLQPIGTGPWRFSKMLKDDLGNIQSYVLTPNPFYYGQKPYLKTLVFKFYNDYQEAVNALRTQNVSALSFVPYSQRDKIPTHNYKTLQLQLPQYTALFFNQTKEPSLKDKNLRLALASAINKTTLVQNVLNGQGEIINSPILSGFIGYSQKVNTVNFNIDEANKLLDQKWTRIQPEEYFKAERENLLKNYQTEIAEAKKQTTSTPDIVTSTMEKIEKEISEQIRQNMGQNQTFYRQDKSENILALTITTADTAEYIKAAETIAEMWRAAGVQTTIQTIPSRQISREILKTRDYQVLLYGEILGNDPDPFAFWHSSQTEYPGLNLAMYANRQVDKILEDARVSTDDKERDTLYKKFQDTLVEEIPAIFLYSPKYQLVVNDGIKGITTKAVFSPSDRFNDLANWYTSTKWQWK